MLDAAASMYEPLRVWDGHEGPRARITIGPGAVAVARKDLARAERTGERAVRRRRMLVDELAAYLLEHGEMPEDRPSRAEITKWSRKSRANMWRATSELDYQHMLPATAVPAMVTLTYPGQWREVAPCGKAVKRHMDLFRKRWRRAWGTDLIAIWKLEFQRRGAPHLHLFCVPPHGFAHDGGGMPFRTWLSRTWADVVAHPDPIEYANHLLAGTGVDFAAGLRASDPQRVAVYFAKHGSFRAKEYQHRVPDLWRAPGQGPGRFWGYWGLSRQTRAVEVLPRVAIQAARLMRRYARAQGVTREARVPRTEGGGVQIRHWADRVVVGLAGAQLVEARRPRWRRVRRRVDRMRRGAGWLAVNDGASFAASMARWLYATVDQVVPRHALASV